MKKCKNCKYFYQTFLEKLYSNYGWCEEKTGEIYKEVINNKLNRDFVDLIALKLTYDKFCMVTRDNKCKKFKIKIKEKIMKEIDYRPSEGEIITNMYILTGLIYSIMERDNISIQELSKRTKISVKRLNRILSGDSNCKIYSLFNILTCLHTPITCVMKFNENVDKV